MIAEAQGHFPDHHIELVAEPDAHHDRVRFTWQLFPEGAGPILTGYDYATVAEDGRLRDVTGFASRWASDPPGGVKSFFATPDSGVAGKT